MMKLNRIRTLVTLVLLSFCFQSCNAVCPVGLGYNAPYDLSASPILSVKSVAFPTGTFYFSPCNEMADATCPGTQEQQNCYVYQGQGQHLGSVAKTKWIPYNNDWSQGAVSMNLGSDVQDFTDCGSYLGNSNVTVIYKGVKGDNSITIKQEPSGTSQQCIFLFEIDSAIVYAANNGGSGSAGGGGLSGGWIFIIILIVVTFVYLVLGVSFNHYKLGKTGAELIPNIGFWRNLPGLVRDGCAFTYTKLRALLCNRGAGGLATQAVSGSYETI